MESQKVRIINEKGEVRFVMPHIAKDKKIMKSYGYRVQDLTAGNDLKKDGSQVDFEKIKSEMKNPEPLDLLEVPQTGEKPKRGRKPNVKK